MSVVDAENEGKVPDFFNVLGIDDIETYDPEAVWVTNSHADSIVAPIGYMRVGDALVPEVSTLDFSRDGHNGAVQGRTGSGRSYFLRSIVLSLATRYGPDRVSLLLADGMGPVMFRGFEALPHTVANVWCDGFHEECFDTLISTIAQEIQRRVEVLELHGCQNSAEYRRERHARAAEEDWPPLPDLMAILDEFCWILEEQPEKRERLIDIASRGPSTGVHLIVASQHFTESMLEGLDEQLGFRFSLSVNRAEHSRALIGTDHAAHLLTYPLHGKMLRKLPSDLHPTPMVGFHIEARYPVRQDDVDGTETEVSGVKMSDLLLDKLATPTYVRVVEEWQLGEVQEDLSRPLFGSGLRRHR